MRKGYLRRDQSVVQNTAIMLRVSRPWMRSSLGSSQSMDTGEQGREVMFAFHDCKPSSWAKALAMRALYRCKGPARVTPVFSDYQRLFLLSHVNFTMMLPLRILSSASCVTRSRTHVPGAIEYGTLTNQVITESRTTSTLEATTSSNCRCRMVGWSKAARVDELRDRAMVCEVEFTAKPYKGQVSHSFLLEILVR